MLRLVSINEFGVHFSADDDYSDNTVAIEFEEECDSCGQVGVLLAFDNSGEEYPPGRFCMACLNTAMELGIANRHEGSSS